MCAGFVRFQVRTKNGNYFENLYLHFPVLEEIVLHLLLLALLIGLLVVGKASVRVIRLYGDNRIVIERVSTHFCGLTFDSISILIIKSNCFKTVMTI